MDSYFHNHEHCTQCGKKLTAFDHMKNFLGKKSKQIIVFLCALCLAARIGTAELDFGSVVQKDHPLNDFSSQSVDHAFNNGNLSATSGDSFTFSQGDYAIDFTGIHKIEYPIPMKDSTEHKAIGDEKNPG